MAGQLRYKTAAELQAAIDEYFAICQGHGVTDENGEAVIYKGQPVIVGAKPPTMTGLAYHLGFKSRQSLLNYKGRKEFLDTITRAKMRVEAYTEERLFDRDGNKGAVFSLTNNFDGWSSNPGPSSDAELEQARKLLEGTNSVID